MPSDDNLTTSEIPIFPLPVVLLPSEVMPLHIFEERYKTMLKDCLAGKKVFGINYHTEKDSWPPSLGKVGTIAQIMAVVPLDDGRMNILTIGTQRYRIKAYQEQMPYLHAEVEIFQDGSDDGSAQAMLPEVIAIYKRASKALKELNEEQSLPDDLPNEVEDCSFAIASTLQISLDQKQALLELRSTKTRLSRIRQYLKELVDKYESRADIHKQAKTNGHGSPQMIKKLQDMS